ncbi:ammonium transporter [Paenibacillus mucilaginosus]|uniref:Ammonium transporter n=3 Tax=Paenibacillus mucilaginosus TaxID=61624 RepID=H6NJ69_9BACL|nr:ammonium transporter [Paenibacillus mucilaginosus]AFC28831.1 ammonium transporter [Paenibacillus mucilaginosus 3016]AFH61007.1 ammonium transporter [Paenibacillus mucilaginosus K02]MCG7215786.1 ammonium transporter [Paenibacillus mucilaginosus]WDM29413.1 ammonium transporter [Paenibacillus mucilaginosus]WFA17593.1 ammonium transporter [Paenibacillus mucilaginosus]
MLKKLLLSTGLMSVMLPTAMAFAAEDATPAQLQGAVDAVWVMLAAILVIFMQAGFALLEAGSTRMKNAGHVAGKTILTFGICAIAFWAVGFGLAFGDGNSFIGMKGFFVDGTEEQAAAAYSSLAYSDVPIGIKFLFQLAFAGVSLAIAFGGFAERAKLSVYFIFSILFVIFIYPVAAHWIWGGGWLAGHGKQDFAGSTVVHLQGATAALVATLMLKPRIGKYNKDKTPNLIPGHNQVLSVLGVIILWIGWFGFNPGSTLSAMGDGFFGYIAMTTNLAAAAGGVAAIVIAWIYFGKADIPSMLNGVLAALVAITASCAFVSVRDAIIIGAVAGILTFFTAQWFEKAGIDDPIYAFSVHGIAGIWGTLANGIFAKPELVEKVGIGKPGLLYGGGLEQLGVQALGIFTTFVFVLIVSFIILYILKVTIGLRVTEEEEVVGLDLSEHGSYGYPEQMKKAAGGSSAVL